MVFKLLLLNKIYFIILLIIFSYDNFKKLSDYIDYISQNSESLIVKRPLEGDEILYGNILSFVEEVGELVEAIRQYKGLSFNKKKVERATLENIGLEAVDVIITLFLILKRLGIEDLCDFIEKKKKLNKDRGY